MKKHNIAIALIFLWISQASHHLFCRWMSIFRMYFFTLKQRDKGEKLEVLFICHYAMVLLVQSRQLEIKLGCVCVCGWYRVTAWVATGEGAAKLHHLTIAGVSCKWKCQDTLQRGVLLNQKNHTWLAISTHTVEGGVVRCGFLLSNF